ncbi:DUF6873 family GME fold protein [uncultured Lutibacter sp.]|uniref:DUF6873 family GME fold protein n=1 Tax=uncultured Lutibacter sp. TaxID=437739 RepID=UPI00260E9A79|nr:hypothetical protein [uncultured Lutibacter sp.]
MYAIIDKRCSEEIKNNLNNYVEGIFEFSSENITYNAISGHPDIFMFQDKDKLIIAPNAPKELFQFLNEKQLQYSVGIKNVGYSVEESSLYNCFSTNDNFFCKVGVPDNSIEEYCVKKKTIALTQSYVRCSLFGIDATKMITSDLGIVKSLKSNAINYFYFEPSEIKIRDHKYGFIGGTMGRLKDKIFFLGNILKHKNGLELHNYITSNKQEVICLGNDYLYDGGGIFFIE